MKSIAGKTATGGRRLIVGLFGFGLLAEAALLSIAVVQVWAVIERIAALPATALSEGSTTGALQLDLIGVHLTLTEGQSYLIFILLFGTVGSFIHAATSFTSYVGNRKFEMQWAWWYFLRPFVGAAVALILLMVIIGGLMTVTSDDIAADPRSFNPYAIAAFAGLAGWFSKSASDKMQEIFATILQNSQDRFRKDKLDSDPAPTIDMLEPDTIDSTGGPPYRIVVRGRRFKDGANVLVGSDSLLGSTWTDEETLHVEITLTLTIGVDLRVINPDGSISNTAVLHVA